MDSVAAMLTLVAIVEYADRAEAAGQRYEDAVLALLDRHGGRLERRLRGTDGRSEVHVITFAARTGYESFLVDPERAALRAGLGDTAPNLRAIEAYDV
jgi:hypothetical protein